MADTMLPKDNPETQCFLFNTVKGKSFDVPCFCNGLSDTYSLDIFGKAFETRAADTEVGKVCKTCGGSDYVPQ